MTFVLNRAAALVVLTLLAWLAPMAAMAEAPVQLWAAESAGHTGPASGQPGCGNTPYAQRAMAIDAVGNTYVTGCSSNGLNTDYLTVKYDPSGAVLWTARYNGTGNGNDKAYALVVDIIRDTVTVTGTSRGSSGGDNYATVQYNSAGVQQWVAIYNGTGNYDDQAIALAVDGSGKTIVTGQSYSNSNIDYATVQYDSTGVQQWVAIYNGTGNGFDYARALVVDGSDKVTVTGQSRNSSGNDDYATVQYDSAGVEQWVATYNGTGNSYDNANALAVDASGNVLVTGTSYSSSGNSDYATVQYNSAGVQQWVAIYNGTGNGSDVANALIVDAVRDTVTVTGNSTNSSGSTDYATVQYSSAGVQQWVAIYNGTADYSDDAYALGVDSSGKVTVTGTSLNSSFNMDYITVQYDSTGMQQWVAIYNGTGNNNDYAYTLAVDVSSKVTVAGRSRNSSGNDDYATVQYDSAGVQQWVAGVITENYYERLDSRKVVVDAVGNSYVAGSGYNGLNDDYRIAKFDPAGTLLWSATYNGTGNGKDNAYALVVGANGNVIVTGSSVGSSGADNYATVQYDSAGVQQWVAIYNGTGNNNDQARAVAVDASGSVTVTGTSVNSNGNPDYATIQYDSAGVQQWLAIYNGTGNSYDGATALVVDASGNVTVTGASYNSSGNPDYATIQYDSAGVQQWVSIYNGTGNSDDNATALVLDVIRGTVTVSGSSRDSSSNYDYTTVQYNNAGVQQWVATYNGMGNGFDSAQALAVAVSGKVIVTGISYNSSGNPDYATIQYDSAGVQQWVAIFNGTDNNDDYASALAVDASGTVTVTGQSNNSNGDYGTVQYDSAGAQQWVHIYDGGRGLQDFAGAIALDTNGDIIIAGTVHHYSGHDRIGVVRLAVGYEVTASAGANGSVAPPSQTVLQADDAQFTITPASGYHVDAVVGTTCSPIDVGGGIWEAANITQDCVVTATFAINTYTLEYAADANGSITGASPQSVDYGEDGSPVSADADPGYHFVQWSDASTSNPRTDSNVTTNISVSASFANADPLIASVTAIPATIYEAESSTITVTASDAESTAINHEFDCDNDGSFEVGLQLSANADCLFATLGNKTVKVRVTDEGGASATSTVAVTVNDSVPVATLAPNASPLEDVPVALNATAGVPSSGEAIASVDVDCDYDGAAFSTDVSASSAAALSCPGYPSGGTRTIAIRATDDEPETGSIVTAMINVIPVNDAPTVVVGTIPAHPALTTGAQLVPGFASFDVGPDDEDLTQTIDDYLIGPITDPNGVLVGGSVDVTNDGTLIYELSGTGGSAIVSIRVRDTGGTANGGINTSAAQSFTINVGPAADLQVAKNNSAVVLHDAENTLYAIVVANAGPNAVTGAHLVDHLPGTLINAAWMCVQASSTATCPTPGVGTGDLVIDVSMGVGEHLRFDMMADVDASPGEFVTNAISISPPDGTFDPEPCNDKAVDRDPIYPAGVFADGFETPSCAPNVPEAMKAKEAMQ